MARKQRRQAVIEVKPPQLAPVHFVDRLLLLPRSSRILVAVIPALTLAFILSPLVDEIYLRFFYSPQTAELPSWITAATAVLMYFAGWYYLVDHPGDDPTSRRETRWYVLVSIGIVTLAVVWFVVLTVLNISVSAE
jgi:hypothetical protein